MSIEEAKNVSQRWPGNWTPATIRENFNQSHPHVVLLKTLWYPEVIEGLRESSTQLFRELEFDMSFIHEHEVPGSFELPLAAKCAFEGRLEGQTHKADIVIALGCVINGETPHFEYVCSSVTQALMNLQMDYSKPLGFGVLTVNNKDQAMARKDKGREAAQAALSSWLTLKEMG